MPDSEAAPQTAADVLNTFEPTIATGTTDIDDSEQTENTAWFPLITIAPATGAPLRNCTVCIDLDKATTGFAAVESTATISFRVARKVDGTNWRGEETGSPADLLSAAIAGDAADGMMVELHLDSVGVTQGARIECRMSADATADMELPYIVMYEATTAATITPIAAA